MSWESVNEIGLLVIKKRRIRKPRVFNGSFTLKSPSRTMGSQIIKKILIKSSFDERRDISNSKR